MTQQPFVSILINNHNYGRFLNAAIDSAINQTYPYSEVIVVDNGSTDNSHEVIARYGDRILSILKEDGGQASAFNAGFAASRGDIICFLDADDLFLPDKVAQVVDTLHTYNNSGWCFHPLKLVDKELHPLSNKLRHSELASFQDLRQVMRQGGLRGKLPFSIPPTTGLSFTRFLLEKILPMPEGQGVSMCDSYLQYSAFTLTPGCFLAKELAFQRVHGGNVYTGRSGREKVLAHVHLMQAYWLRRNFPELSKFTNKLLAAGLSVFWRERDMNKQSQEIIDKYFTLTTPLEKIKVYARTAFYYLKTFNRLL